MADTITQGQFMRFLKKYHFVAKGKKQNRYIGRLNGKSCLVTFHYHKDNDIIPTGTVSALAKQLGLNKKDLIDYVKKR